MTCLKLFLFSLIRTEAGNVQHAKLSLSRWILYVTILAPPRSLSPPLPNRILGPHNRFLSTRPCHTSVNNFPRLSFTDADRYDRINITTSVMVYLMDGPWMSLCILPMSPKCISEEWAVGVLVLLTEESWVCWYCWRKSHGCVGIADGRVMGVLVLLTEESWVCWYCWRKSHGCVGIADGESWVRWHCWRKSHGCVGIADGRVMGVLVLLTQESWVCWYCWRKSHGCVGIDDRWIMDMLVCLTDEPCMCCYFRQMSHECVGISDGWVMGVLVYPVN